MARSVAHTRTMVLAYERHQLGVLLNVVVADTAGRQREVAVLCQTRRVNEVRVSPLPPSQQASAAHKAVCVRNHMFAEVDLANWKVGSRCVDARFEMQSSRPLPSSKQLPDELVLMSYVSLSLSLSLSFARSL